MGNEIDKNVGGFAEFVAVADPDVSASSPFVETQLDDLFAALADGELILH